MMWGDVGRLYFWIRKDDLKKRGMPSPDEGDAGALTFAEPVRKRRGRKPKVNLPIA